MTGNVKNLKFHGLRETVSMVGFISVYVKFLPRFPLKSVRMGSETGITGLYLGSLLTNLQSVLS
jgi:hypothetical protein